MATETGAEPATGLVTQTGNRGDVGAEVVRIGAGTMLILLARRTLTGKESTQPGNDSPWYGLLHSVGRGLRSSTTASAAGLAVFHRDRCRWADDASGRGPVDRRVVVCDAQGQLVVDVTDGRGEVWPW